MTTTRRTRALQFGGYRSTYKVQNRRASTQLWENGLPNGTDVGPSYVGSQITDSEGHPWPPPKGTTSGDVGGPFFTSKAHGVIPMTPFVHTIEGNGFGPFDKSRFVVNAAFGCPIETVSGKPKWPTPQNSTQSSLNAAGAQAVSLCRPTASGVELSTALGELIREGLPALVGHTTWENRTLAARLAGDEYLNVQFGWAPMVSDIRSFASTVQKAPKILRQYNADKGKSIRRQFSFPTERNVTFTPLGSAAPYGLTWSTGYGGATSTGFWSKTTTTTKRRWFSGAFVYGHPSTLTGGDGLIDLAARADKLFGISLTPDVLWNLSPWSWAVDWFTNTGSVLSTIGDYLSQGLVMKYGYIMEETSIEVKYSLSGAVVNGIPVSVPDSRLVVKTKSRTRANPFGFGITWDGLSSAQLAIAAALGISRT